MLQGMDLAIWVIQIKEWNWNEIQNDKVSRKGLKQQVPKLLQNIKQNKIKEKLLVRICIFQTSKAERERGETDHGSCCLEVGEMDQWTMDAEEEEEEEI